MHLRCRPGPGWDIKNKMSILSFPINLKSLSNDFSVTSEMKLALKAIASGESPIFISGGAGTGKSTLLKMIRKLANSSLAVLAPTGIAALNVSGMTIHSFFRLPPSLMTHHNFKRSPSAQDLFRRLSGIIIDEISMVRADLLDAMDATLRMHLDSGKPFGGVQIVMLGDLSQLPPVLAGKELEQHFSKMYESRFFFDAHSLRSGPLHRYNLTETFRQEDSAFVGILNRLRFGTATNEDFAKLNSRVVKGATNKTDFTITSTRRLAEDINRVNLEGLAGSEICYHAQIKGGITKQEFPADEILRLKSKASIMMLQNNGEFWQNGTLGTVIDFGNPDGKEAIKVSLPKGEYWIPRSTWDVIRYVRNPIGPGLIEEVVGSFLQFPMRLSWAVTVHKCQGMTFDKIAVNLKDRMFEHGQLYVTLSRCRTLNGISLTREIRHSDLHRHARVNWFESQK